MKALICPNQIVETGYRIAQIEPDDRIFPVAEPLFWFPCNENVVPNQYWYDPTDQSIKQIPQPEIEFPLVNVTQNVY